MLPENIINFINSKDSLTKKHNIAYRIVFLFMLLICCGTEVLFFCIHVSFIGKMSKLFDLVFVVILAALGISNFVASLLMKYERYHHMFYGINSLLLSLYFFYFSIRIALFPFNEFYGLLGICLWLITSILCIMSIMHNIRYDKYNLENSDIHWFTDDKTNEKYGIVISKYTIVSCLTIVGVIIAIVIIYSLYPKLFTAVETTFSCVWQVTVISGLLLLGYVGCFGWKLVIKQFYLNRARD